MNLCDVDEPQLIFWGFWTDLFLLRARLFLIDVFFKPIALSLPRLMNSCRLGFLFSLLYWFLKLVKFDNVFLFVVVGFSLLIIFCWMFWPIFLASFFLLGWGLSLRFFRERMALSNRKWYFLFIFSVESIIFDLKFRCRSWLASSCGVSNSSGWIVGQVFWLLMFTNPRHLLSFSVGLFFNFNTRSWLSRWPSYLTRLETSSERISLR